MIPARELLRHLRSVADQEAIKVTDAALGLVARAAEGSVRDSLSLFDQVLAFTGDEVKDDEVAGLLGLVDRQLLHRAARAMVDGSSLAMLELVESLADYGADYRHFVRELLLHLRDLLLVKLAPEGSPLLAQVLPEELPGLREIADALSEEDLLRGLDLLTQAESELRQVTDPRVAVDLVLLKLVQTRKLVPFAELVSRVERLAGGAGTSASPSPAPQRSLSERGAPPPTPGPRPFESRGGAPSAPARASAPAPRPAAPERPAPVEPDDEPQSAAPPAPAGSPAAILAAMIGECQGRPSLAAPLRAATASQQGDTLVLELPPDFLAFARAHAEDYRALARKASGQPLALRIEAGASDEPTAEKPTPEAEKRRKLREEAEREPAVQEALDLFDGRVVDVREAQPGREDA
jgi:DNA polymerase-3 subunit gamma/tau